MHWHEQEDEFVYILQGECVLVEETGETILKAGDCAGWKANTPHGHCIVNNIERGRAAARSRHARAERTLTLSRLRSEFERDADDPQSSHKDGTPY